MSRVKINMGRCRSKTKSGKICKLACMGDQDVCFMHAQDCPICLAKLGHMDETSKLKCGHQFHASCIYRWLDQKNTCPCCRKPVRDQVVEVEYDPDLDNVWNSIVPTLLRDLVSNNVISTSDRIRIGMTISVIDASTGMNIISTNIQ